MGDGHDVHVGELRTTFAPVSMGEDVMPADLAAGLDLTSLRNTPVEQGVVARHSRAAAGRFYVLEKRGEPSDDAALVERFSDTRELGE